MSCVYGVYSLPLKDSPFVLSLEVFVRMLSPSGEWGLSVISDHLHQC